MKQGKTILGLGIVKKEVNFGLENLEKMKCFAIDIFMNILI